MAALGFVVRACFWLTVLAIPFLGLWLGGSVAAMWNGPMWVAWTAGALLFPVGPMLWELVAYLRKSKRGSTSFFSDLARSRRDKASLNVGDRLLLRTLAINVPFLAAWVYFDPGSALTAVATRGDWMLDAVEAPWADNARRAFARVADSLQAYNSAFDNEWAAESESDTDREPEPSEVEVVGPEVTPEPVEPAVPVVPPIVLTLVVPEGATVQVRDQMHTESTTLELPPDAEWPVSVSFSDQRKLSCQLSAGRAREVSFAEHDGVWTLGDAPCEELRAPDPAWRPVIRMEGRRVSTWITDHIAGRGLAPDDAERILKADGLVLDGETLRQAPDGTWMVLGPPVVLAEQVLHVHRVTPYFRLELDEAGTNAMCDATRDAGGERFGVLVDGQLRFVHLVGEAQCNGFVPLETGDRAVQHDWSSTPDADAEALSLAWPVASDPHPLASVIQGESIDELGKEIAERTGNEREAARLIHDWVVTHVTYDHGSLEPGKRQPQDADTVLRRGTGVCSGYANLVVAVSKAAGLDAVYITGNVRKNDGALAGSSHAWNAVKVDGKWALMDATWDVVSDAEGGGATAFRTDYLFTPPEVFRYDHLPERASWQLHGTPISKGDFIRQPALSPGFFASGLALVDPKRSSVDAHDTVVVTMDNPKGRSIAGRLGEERCAVTGTSRVSVRCKVPRSGRHQLDVFENKARVGSHRHVASWVVNGI